MSNRLYFIKKLKEKKHGLGPNNEWENVFFEFDARAQAPRANAHSFVFQSR